MTIDWTWDEMIEEFRALGGVADNVYLGAGPLGRGIFVQDPKQPAHIYVPNNLLINAENLFVKNGILRIRKKSNDRSREEEFFEAFENTFSWGGGGRADCEAKNELFLSVPKPIVKLISTEFVKSYSFNRNGPNATLNRFLATRKIRMKDGRKVLMPVLELVNHDLSGRPFAFRSGISIKGVFRSEVLARYNVTDPMGTFFTWGFPGNSFHAYSLPLSLKIGKRKLIIQRNLKDKKQLGRFMVPTLREKGDSIILSYLMIGNARYPRLARGTFYRLMRNIEVSHVEELFDRIHSTNISRFLKLLLELEKFEGPSIPQLRNMALLQLDAISHCAGARAP